MSYYEALEDGLKVIPGKEKFDKTIYFPKCHICGEEVFSYSYNREETYLCKKCKAKKAERKALENLFRVVSKNENPKSYEAQERKFKRAVVRIKKCKDYDEFDYERAFAKVHDKIHRHGWFDSTEEVMTAIELEKYGMNYRHQVRFGSNYKADFVLDDEKIVLEIDGRLFHSGEEKLEKDIVRDNLIILALGLDWEVIRITDDYINENISQLVPALEQIKEERKRIRAKYGGNLPSWYSRRESTKAKL